MEIFSFKIQLKRRKEKRKNIKENKIECKIKMLAVIPTSVITKCKWTKFSP